MLNDTEWDVQALAAENLRRPELSQLLQALHCIARGIDARCRHVDEHAAHLYENYQQWNESNFQADIRVFMEYFSSYWRDSAQLFSLGVGHLTRLLVPLAFEHMGNHTSDEGLRGWINDMKRVRDMLHIKLRGLEQDVQSVGNLTLNYKIEEEQNNPGKYILRRPVTNDDLLDTQQRFISFRDDFSELCQRRQPKASQMLGLADALYAFYYRACFQTLQRFSEYNSSDIRVVDDKWQLEDRSDATLIVDTGCLQLLADALENPTCPLEDLPLETIKHRVHCRERLWDDLVHPSPYIPVTSYLAYTQRTKVNLCLLAWMAVNSFSICQDVPFSAIQSVHDARCYFDNPGNESCPQSDATDAICSVSRAVLLLKCRDFTFRKIFDECHIRFDTKGSSSKPFRMALGDRYRGNKKATEVTLSYKDSLNDYTLKYRNFKVERLKPLEISFIAVNIIFRFLTAGVYMYFPQLRNMPGMILLSFQVTGLVQILCSEVVYRMAGFPDLSIAVLIDTALTFLSCLWLNTFCYVMYACARYLRLPNSLTAAQARSVFRRNALYALVPWCVVCSVCASLENVSKPYLFYSRMIFLLGISLSVVYNLACLGFVAYTYLHTQNSIQDLKIFTGGKFFSKKQVVYLSVKTVILSGIGTIIRIGFHQAEGITRFVYYVHIATMLQGPVLFVFFVCNETALPVLKNRVLAWWNPNVINPGQELCSSAERNLRKMRNEEPHIVESPV